MAPVRFGWKAACVFGGGEGGDDEGREQGRELLVYRPTTDIRVLQSYFNMGGRGGTLHSKTHRPPEVCVCARARAGVVREREREKGERERQRASSHNLPLTSGEGGGGHELCRTRPCSWTEMDILIVMGGGLALRIGPGLGGKDEKASHFPIR